MSQNMTVTAPQPSAPSAERSPFPKRWRVGEHVFVAGDTGSGKTYLISQLVKLRNYVVFLRTKADDIELEGFRRVRTADAMDDYRMTRILLDPSPSHKLRESYHMLTKAFEQGAWTVVVDELWYVENRLRLTEYVEQIQTQGRSMKLTIVCGAQRPARISRFAISQSTHVFSFALEGRDVQIMKESASPRIVEPINALAKHRFVYYHRPSRQLYPSGNAKRLSDVIVGRASIGGVAMPDE